MTANTKVIKEFGETIIGVAKDVQELERKQKILATAVNQSFDVIKTIAYRQDIGEATCFSPMREESLDLADDFEQKEEFYNLMQDYRTCPVTDEGRAAELYKDVRDYVYIKNHVLNILDEELEDWLIVEDMDAEKELMVRGIFNDILTRL